MRAIDADHLRRWILSRVFKTQLSAADVIDQIDREDTIEPQRKTGKWIDYSEDGYVECPFCHSATNCDDNIDELHFCFSCGARMSRSDWTTTEEMSGWIKEVNE